MRCIARMKRKQVYKLSFFNAIFSGTFPYVDNYGDVVLSERRCLTIDKPMSQEPYSISSEEEENLYHKMKVSEKIKDHC